MQMHVNARLARADLRATIRFVSASLVRHNAARYDAIMKIRDVIRMVEADGWRFINQEGSHRHYKHPVKKGRVTIAGKPGVDIPTGTLKNVLKQAGLEKGNL